MTLRRRLLMLGALAAGLARAEDLVGTGVDANTATRAQLESLPGLGPALAQRLLAARPFSGWPDLMQRVPGIKAATARRLSAAGLRVAGEPWTDAGRAASAAGGEPR